MQELVRDNFFVLGSGIFLTTRSGILVDFKGSAEKQVK